MKAKSKFQILGLFRGVGLPFRFESAPIRMPNMIWLYRRPILAYWSRYQDTLEAIIAHVLVHKIGHAAPSLSTASADEVCYEGPTEGRILRLLQHGPRAVQVDADRAGVRHRLPCLRRLRP